MIIKRKKTYLPKEHSFERKWYLVDAKDQILGRLATRIARILAGKHKPIYTPHILCGDCVVVINAKHIRVTGKKLTDKIYQKYSGYHGGRKELSLEELLAKNPVRVMTHAVAGMLPKNRLAKRMMLSLKVYPEAEHDQQAQQPQPITL